jgi:hypothetical protein
MDTENAKGNLFQIYAGIWRDMASVIAEQFLKGLVTSARRIEISNVF